MRRASYRYGIAWIAENDEAGGIEALDESIAASYPSSLLLADLFGVEPERVGRDIVRARKRQAKTGAA